MHIFVLLVKRLKQRFGRCKNRLIFRKGGRKGRTGLFTRFGAKPRRRTAKAAIPVQLAAGNAGIWKSTPRATGSAGIQAGGPDGREEVLSAGRAKRSAGFSVRSVRSGRSAALAAVPPSSTTPPTSSPAAVFGLGIVTVAGLGSFSGRRVRVRLQFVSLDRSFVAGLHHGWIRPACSLFPAEADGASSLVAAADVNPALRDWPERRRSDRRRAPPTP